MTCECAKYDHITMDRAAISKRVRETKKLRTWLKPLARSNDKEHELFVCEACSQYWQSSRAWNWGNDVYCFKVPQTTVDEWLLLRFVSPDELMVYGYAVSDFLNSGIELGDVECNETDCTSKAIGGLKKCVNHHLANLQQVGSFPSEPEGRWFFPYEERNFKPNV
ncbi:hypothetical protein DU002_03905 [Corallincola holothuriorum]|uniref:Uncharacterized protein n=1 Tax=Corallincola holothuriorum TaxID=2282215 RepID=A0A368NPM7_9GAMM|nr:hypothetical protein [Corallincola holothuriorum]RCU51624.1 hypothetical protein DU002_03905 [Corallincola holothuriorum]